MNQVASRKDSTISYPYYLMHFVLFETHFEGVIEQQKIMEVGHCHRHRHSGVPALARQLGVLQEPLVVHVVLLIIAANKSKSTKCYIAFLTIAAKIEIKTVESCTSSNLLDIAAYFKSGQRGCEALQPCLLC